MELERRNKERLRRHAEWQGSIAREEQGAERSKYAQLQDYQIQLMELERVDRATSREHAEEQKKIAREEQDEDRWRYVSPGRDPVGEERGPGM